MVNIQSFSFHAFTFKHFLAGPGSGSKCNERPTFLINSTRKKNISVAISNESPIKHFSLISVSMQTMLRKELCFLFDITSATEKNRLIYSF